VTEKLLTKRSVADTLGVSLRTVDNLIAAGKLRVVRPGGLNVVRIEPGEIARLVKESRTRAAQTAGKAGDPEAA
jgi:excisionase family DNA binding protein